MLQSLNRTIAKGGMWIFLFAATYKFVFYIINLVTAFNAGGAHGVKVMFGSLFDMALELAMLGVLLEVSRKVAETYPPEPVRQFNPMMGQGAPNMMPGAPMPGAPAQNAPMQTPVQNAAPAGDAWFCSACGTQNASGTGFCSKCGKPK